MSAAPLPTMPGATSTPPWPGLASGEPVEFRPARPEDAAECVALRGQTRENAVSRERLESLGITAQTWGEDIRTGELPGHVCWANGRMAGYCFGSRTDGEVVVLALLPPFEALGIGKALLNRMCNDLTALGHQRLFLGARPTRKAAPTASTGIWAGAPRVS